MKKGFTLVELLIVIGMLAILITAAVITINPLGQFSKSRDGQRKADLSELQRALELYYQDFGRYPDNSADFKISVNATPKVWGGSWSPYMAKLPIDPQSTKSYIYFSPSSSAGQTYYIYANLERAAQDKQSCNSGNVCTSISSGGAGVPSSNACGAVCNYGVSSPNVTP
jgi:general secretion pathway protein G